jgi:hypothetical protein
VSRQQRVILRDLIIFQIKLFLDGLKDVALAPLSLLAAMIDLLLPGKAPGHRFYAVMGVGEKFDRWLNLFGATDRVSASTGGLFGASRTGSDGLVNRIEELFTGAGTPGGAAGAAQSRR